MQFFNGRTRIMETSNTILLDGRVVDVKKDKENATVILDVGRGNRITSSMPVESLKDKDIRPGHMVQAIIKPASIMIETDDLNYDDCSLGCDA